MKQLSGVGVLDKAALVLNAVEASPASLGDLVTRTGLTRATAHRLAVALEVHRLVGRDPSGRFVPGPRLAAGGAAPLPWALLAAAAPVLAQLRD
ncbi:helix-turn-helix domain-containing protein, partial [Candidatus Protofrankia californiensis]|uniref:helix-turn-helix domain-containing protein n=2 Tax=Protofrankia TaxID=2994361 RepID=UPI001F49FD28